MPATCDLTTAYWGDANMFAAGGRPVRESRMPSDVQIAHALAFDAELFRRKVTYVSRKGGVVKAINSYGMMAARRLDADRSVASFSYRSVRYSYYSTDDRTTFADFIDFDVTKADGTRLLVYVGSEAYMVSETEICRVEAAESYARRCGSAFAQWTEPQIFGDSPEYAQSVLVYMLDEVWKQSPPEEGGEEEPNVHSEKSAKVLPPAPPGWEYVTPRVLRRKEPTNGRAA